VLLLMSLLLVSGAAFGFQRIRARPGAAWAGVIFWAAAILAIVLLYNWLN
jgi:hypothetical protein